MAETIGALIISSTLGQAAAGFTIGATGITLAQAAGTTALLAGTIGLNYALAASPKQQKPADGTLSIRQPNPVRQGGYGRTRVAGSYMLFETNGGISIDVLALISGRICGVKQFYLNEDAPSRTLNLIISMADGRYYGGSVAVNWRFGLPAEVAYSEAISNLPSIWTGAHRGDGVASMEMFCLQAPNVNAQTTYFPNGKPEPSVELDLYPIWDPRDPVQDPEDRDSFVAYPIYDPSAIYAAGARVVRASDVQAAAYDAGTNYARYAVVTFGGAGWYSRIDNNLANTPGSDLSKWLPLGAVYYSQVDGNSGFTPDLFPDKWCSVQANPVLQLIDFLTDADHGMGLDREILIVPALVQLKVKADLCDARMVDKNGILASRYTSNGKFNFDDDPADVIGQILATCDGWMTEDGDGALVVEVGVYAAPTVHIASRHIVGFSINYGIADEQIVNELTLSFTHPQSNYKEVSGQPWRNEDDISARGVTRSQSLPLKWVDRHSQARRLAKRAMARLSAAHGTVTCTLYGLAALGQRWVNLSYPFLPELGTDDVPVVVEFSRGTVDFLRGVVTFEWILVDPATIDAWNATTEEGVGPPFVASAVAPRLDFHVGQDSQYWMMGFT